MRLCFSFSKGTASVLFLIGRLPMTLETQISQSTAVFHEIKSYGSSASRSSSSHSLIPLSASSRLRSYHELKSSSGISPP